MVLVVKKGWKWWGRNKNRGRNNNRRISGVGIDGSAKIKIYENWAGVLVVNKAVFNEW